MKLIFTISLCFLALSLSAQEDCLLINEEINDFVVMGTFDSHQYYISENPVPISDGFYEVYNDLASLYSGNLLTIGSMEEDEYVYSTFFNGGFSNLSSYYYIGLYNTDPSNLCCGQGNPPGVWEWINGESVEYTNWDINANQPSGDELYASGGGSWGGVWADVSGGHQGYIIIEVEQCPVSVSGCLDSLACNFNEYATEDDGSCDYTCCPGPGCCNIGMTWNWELGICETSIPTDSNLDGCTDLNDLMDLLAAYGDCALSGYTSCGDNIEHEGYSYSTVQIGDQCWFAENCRYLPSVSHPAIELSDNNPYYYVYDHYYGSVNVAKTNENYSNYGTLYNWHSLFEPGICPSGWHVASNDDWDILIESLGGYLVAGDDLKAQPPIWNGTNITGFNGLHGGRLNHLGTFVFADGPNTYGFFWSSTNDLNIGDSGFFYMIYDENSVVTQDVIYRRSGLSVRCIKD